MTHTAQAAVLEEVGSDFLIQQVELDDPRPGEVLVRTVASGVCGTDGHVQHGGIPFPLPGIVGHEGAGIVEAVGSGVTSVAPGDLLTRAELATFTGISRATFAQSVKTGDGPAMTKLGRAARYRRTAVVAW